MRTWQIIVMFVFAGGSAWAAGSWHVVEIADRHICYRVTALPDGAGWRDRGAFSTFRQAGAWEWRHRDICRVMAS